LKKQEMSGSGPKGTHTQSAGGLPGGTDSARLLRRALAVHQEGNLDEAERLYRMVLANASRSADALHFLGVLASQRGRPEEAVDLIGRAIEINPANPAAHYNRANALRELKRPDEALAGYDRVIALKRDHIAALNNRGATLHSVGRYEEAVASYDRAIAIKPDYVDALANRGDALLELGKSQDALASYDRALLSSPDEARAHGGRGNALIALNRAEEALASYNRGLGLAPTDGDLLNNRGNALNRLHRYREAIASFSQALASDSRSLEARANRGDTYMQLRKYAEALADYNAALAIRNDSVQALYGRGSALIELNGHGEAADTFERLLAIRPDYPYARGMMVHAKRTACDWRNEAEGIDRLVAEVRAGKRAASPLVLLATSDSAIDKRLCAETLIKDKFSPASPLPLAPPYRHDRIRLAYLSADFREHAVAMLTAGMFEHHDRTRFETIAISYGQDDKSELRRRLKGSFEHFIEASETSDADIAGRLRQMEADIAVDLTGFTGNSRPGLLALRPAPIQVNFLGFAGTLGADFMDYIICDRIVIPDDQQSAYSEKLAQLPDTFLPHDSKRRVAAGSLSRSDVGLPAEGFVFCSFNNSYKFGPEIFDVWMRLLRQVEGSVLWLPRTNLAAMANLTREAELRGVPAQRLIFASYMPNAEDHLARLRFADLFLDTLPYNAHTTASDALWAGLPLLTCHGKSFAGRVAASLLQAAGLPELIAASLADYEALALKFAREPTLLAAIRDRLASNRDRCALFDTARFTRHLEAAYRHMYGQFMLGRSPASFAVERVNLLE
jgi:predicted O-linked N-acetylglucosamine transferase (SPINDLY family)